MRVVGRIVVLCAGVLLVLGLAPGPAGSPPTETPAGADTPSGTVAPTDAATRGPRPAPTRRDRERRTPQRRPSMVLVLMDDFSMDLLQTMPAALEMQRRGASYEHSYVVDSLCCVSRSSLLTGQYPHQTGVLTNTANTPNPYGPIGGWEAFAARGNLERSVNVRLQQAGWTTGYIGKYLNQYEAWSHPLLPPGWSDWQAVFANAYDGWDFDLTDTVAGEVVVSHVDAPPAWASEAEKDAAYVGNVIADRAVDFVREHRADAAPYFLAVAPFGTHSRVGPVPHYPGDPGFPPAFRDRPHGGDLGSCGAVPCAALGVDDLPGFGDDQADNAPRRADGTPVAQWRTHLPTLSRDDAVGTLRNRARMAQAVDRMLARLLAAVGRDTYVVLTSDNGFHIGQHGLDRGKGTPFASDVRVPLVVTGPGVVPGVRQEVVSNLDLAPTFEELAGLEPAGFRSGTSLAPTLVDPAVDRRRFTFFEHTWARTLGTDPDALYAGGTMDLVPSYVAVRSRTGLLVRLDLDPGWEGVDHAWEYYDYDRVGWERTNGYGDPRHRAEVALLTRRLEWFDRCTVHTGDAVVPDSCRRLTQ